MKRLYVPVLLALAAAISAASPGSADTYYVPDDFVTIQAALDAAANGDEIIVRDGTHAGTDLTFAGKALTLRSENGPSACIIEGAESGWVFRFGNESSDSILDGFTITHGPAGGIVCMSYSSLAITNCIVTGNGGEMAGFGGGIYCSYSDPTITNCVITDNSLGAFGDGGGIMCWSASPTIANCVISGNSVGYMGAGGGIHCYYYSSPVITNCTITGNSATDNGGGGGIYSMNSTPVITNCTISGNSSHFAGGGLHFEGAAGLETLINCIVWGNETALDVGNEIYIGTYGHVLTVGSTDVRDRLGFDDVYVDPLAILNWLEGNINADPLFVGAGDFHLTAGSPCVDSGAAAAIDDDIDGDPRPRGAGFDMGSDEFYEVSMRLVPDADEASRGGSLGYDVTVTNHTDVVQTFEYWTMVRLPNGSMYPPSGALFGPHTVNLPPFASGSAHLSHAIPVIAPLGMYTYNAYIGPNPPLPTNERHFDFEVAP